MKKEEVFIDLSKLSDEQRKHIISLLPDCCWNGQYVYNADFAKHLKYNSYHQSWVTGLFSNDKRLKELAYPEFIKLFDGGDGEELIEHICKYCGCLTTQPDSDCYAKPKNTMETLYRKVAVSERLPQFGQRVIALVLEQNDLGLSKFLWNVSYHDDTKDFHMDNEGVVNIEYWLEPIPDPTAQLQADKEELLELMAEMKESFDHKAWVTEMELMSFSSRIESLIQKHKK